MAQTVTPFEQRLRRLMRKHSRMSHGIVHKMGRDGLITAHPRRRMPSFPLRGVVIMIGAAFLFKAFLYATLGASVYVSRVELLQSGSIVEQAGAWLMQPDNVTIWIAAQINGFLV